MIFPSGDEREMPGATIGLVLFLRRYPGNEPCAEQTEYDSN
jgi:hypothetical protein